MEIWCGQLGFWCNPPLRLWVLVNRDNIVPFFADELHQNQVGAGCAADWRGNDYACKPAP